jgi:hypothetical protein
MARSPRRRIHFVTVAGGLKVLPSPVGLTKTSADLTPATGARTTRFCRPRPVFAKRLRRHVHVRRSIDEAGSSAVRLRAGRSLTDRSLPCDSFARPMLPRPPHPIPTFVTMANAPLSRRDGGSYGFDLGPVERQLILEIGLDGWNRIDLVQEIRRGAQVRGEYWQ